MRSLAAGRAAAGCTAAKRTAINGRCQGPRAPPSAPPLGVPPPSAAAKRRRHRAQKTHAPLLPQLQPKLVLLLPLLASPERRPRPAVTKR